MKTEAKRARAHAYYVANRDRIIARIASKYAPHPKAKQTPEQREAHRLAKNARSREQHHANREFRLAQKRAWSAANRHRGAAYSTQRRAAKLRATPAWADHDAIADFYSLAQIAREITGMPWEVDHLVPLVSERVSGLHVLANLALSLRRPNREKHNRHWPDMPA